VTLFNVVYVYHIRESEVSNDGNILKQKKEFGRKGIGKKIKLFFS